MPAGEKRVIAEPSPSDALCEHKTFLAGAGGILDLYFVDSLQTPVQAGIFGSGQFRYGLGIGGSETKTHHACSLGFDVLADLEEDIGAFEIAALVPFCRLQCQGIEPGKRESRRAAAR